MKRKFRWGVIGTGGIARAFAKDLELTDGDRVTHFGSRTPAKAEALAREFGATPITGYENLVNADVDAIYVATPHSLHSQNAILALSAGKPVLVEKPFAGNAQQAKAMIDSAQSQKIPLMEAMWSRFLPNFIRLRGIVNSGVIGEIISIQADHGQALPKDPYYRLHSPELAGGALLDLGIYPISLASMLLGRPEKIIADGVMNESGVDSQTSMIFTYENGAQANLTTTLLVRTPCVATIVGSIGRVEIDSNFYTPTSMRTVISGETKEYPNLYLGHGLREQALAFKDLIESGEIESKVMSHSESLEIMETMDEIRQQIGLRYPFES
ncbi:MAG: Gfo/Idh/MocA family protein [Candidatus Nanopelagicaceae bacterium]